MGKGRWIYVIIVMDILNKQCEIYKLCTLIMLAGGVVFSQKVLSFVVSLWIFKINETEQNISEIRLRKKIDELLVLSPSGYIYICVVTEVYLQLFQCFSVYPLFFWVAGKFNKCYTAAFPLSHSEIH